MSTIETKNEFALKFKALFDVYKGMVSSLGTTSPENTKYRILISKEKIDGNDQDIKINLCIYDIIYDRGFTKYFERDRLSNSLNYLSINFPVRKEYYEYIINCFINDFCLNYKVSFTYYTRESWLTINNEHFQLCIRCDDECDREFAEAKINEINDSRIRGEDNEASTGDVPQIGNPKKLVKEKKPTPFLDANGSQIS